MILKAAYHKNKISPSFVVKAFTKEEMKKREENYKKQPASMKKNPNVTIVKGNN